MAKEAMNNSSQNNRKNASNNDIRGTVISATVTVLITSIAVLVFDLVHASLGRTVLIIMAILIFSSLLFVYRNQLLPARVITPVAVFLTLTYFLLEGDGIHDATIIGYPIIVVLAGLLLGEIGVIVFGFLTTAVIAGIAYSELNGALVKQYSMLLDSLDVNIFWLLNLASSLIIFFLIRRLTKVAEHAQHNEIVQVEANQELSALKNNLQERVDRRTTSLQRRNRELQASARVARAALGIKDVSSLLTALADLISEEFNYYHTGIFVLDTTSDSLVLNAASSDSGQRMLQRGHRVQINSQTTIGATAQERRAHIALDVGPNAVFFNDPDLSLTRSQIALPLISQGQVLGVLDLHSEQEHVFDQLSSEVLQMLADQIALAITNIRLAEETQLTISKLEALTQQQTSKTWHEHLQKQTFGYTYSYLGLKPLVAATEEEAGTVENDGTHIHIPIGLRGQRIGTIKLSRDEGRHWSEKEHFLVNEIALQIGLAVENARLVQDTQEQARREQLVAEISARMRETLDMETVIQTAVKDIRRSMNLHDVTIQLGNAANDETA